MTTKIDFVTGWLSGDRQNEKPSLFKLTLAELIVFKYWNMWEFSNDPVGHTLSLPNNTLLLVTHQRCVTQFGILVPEELIKVGKEFGAKVIIYVDGIAWSKDSLDLRSPHILNYDLRTHKSKMLLDTAATRDIIAEIITSCQTRLF